METTATHTLKTAAGDACAACGAPLAPDQRYCVQCGQRRGPAQLPAATSSSSSTTTVTEVAATAPPRPPRSFGAATAVAGVATLLIAMGVGVLIGRSSQHSDTSRASTPVQVVTVGGGGAATAAAPAAAAAAPARATKTAKGAAKKAAAPKPATQNVKGTNLKLPAKSVVKVGQAGKGPGYTNGKFTGDFFGN